MSRAERLRPAVRQQERVVETTARGLRDALDKQQATRERLAQLQRYEAEYQADLRSRHGDPELRLDVVRCYRGILDQLATAIAQEKQRLDSIEADVAERQQSWQDARARLQALQQTSARLRVAESRRRERVEEREQEDRPRRAKDWPPP